MVTAFLETILEVCLWFLLKSQYTVGPLGETSVLLGLKAQCLYSALMFSALLNLGTPVTG